jgi:hypothetical protein
VPRNEKIGLLQFAATRCKTAPFVFIILQALFCSFTPDFLCFHKLPASFLQNRGWGYQFASKILASSVMEEKRRGVQIARISAKQLQVISRDGDGLRIETGGPRSLDVVRRR